MKSIFFITLSLIFSFKSYSLDFDHNYPLIKKAYEISIEYGTKDKDFYKKYNFYELKKNKVLLESFLNYVKFLKIEDYKKFTKEEKISFLVNLYNSFMMNAILKKMPIERFQELSNITNDFYFRKQVPFISNSISSLSEIEEKILFLSDDSRVLFFLYKGTFSSPYVREPLLASKFDDLLQINFDNFVRKNIMYYPSLKVIFISRLFSIYFKNKDKKSFKAYISKLSKIPEKKIKKIKYYQYDWKINSYWLN